MNSFILISTNPEKRQDYLNLFSQEHHISAFDRTVIEEEGSIGIEIVRKFQQSLLLKPFQGQTKSIVLENAQNLTMEAQNAMLKLLEEPPVSTYIFLSSTTDQHFLPTILSRCQIIHLSEDEKALTTDETRQLGQEIDIMRSGTISEKLALAETLASKKEALPVWLEQVLSLLRKEMLKKEEKSQDAAMLVQLQETYKLLKTSNVNPRSLLEHCFLTI